MLFGRHSVAWPLAAALVLTGSLRVAAHGDLDARLARATRAIERAPATADPLLARAHLHRRGGNFAAAHADLDVAARREPGRGAIASAPMVQSTGPS